MFTKNTLFVTNLPFFPIITQLIQNTKPRYLKTVDKFNEYYVFAYVAPSCSPNLSFFIQKTLSQIFFLQKNQHFSGVKFLLLQQGEKKNDDTIRQFLTEAHESYIKVLLNPFYEIGTPITNPEFDAKIKKLAPKYLT